MRAYLGGLLMTYNLEAILKYRRRSSYDLRSRSRLQVHRGRSSYNLFSPTLWGARAYVGDLPMTDDLEVILKYCGRSSYDLRSQSHLEVLWGDLPMMSWAQSWAASGGGLGACVGDLGPV